MTSPQNVKQSCFTFTGHEVLVDISNQTWRSSQSFLPCFFFKGPSSLWL